MAHGEWTVPVFESPHVCPVCCGQREVMRGFYDALQIAPGVVAWPAASTGEREMCRTCMGSGVLWRHDATPTPPAGRP